MDKFAFFKSIPGIGNVTGAMILGEIGNIERFKNVSTLLAFAGLDSSAFESGDFESKTREFRNEDQNIFALPYLLQLELHVLAKEKITNSAKSIRRNDYKTNITIQQFVQLARIW